MIDRSVAGPVVEESKRVRERRDREGESKKQTFDRHVSHSVISLSTVFFFLKEGRGEMKSEIFLSKDKTLVQLLQVKTSACKTGETSAR